MDEQSTTPAVESDGGGRSRVGRGEGFSAALIDELMRDAYAEGYGAGDGAGYGRGLRAGQRMGRGMGIEECNDVWNEKLRRRAGALWELRDAAKAIKHRSKLIARVQELAGKALSDHMALINDDGADEVAERG